MDTPKEDNKIVASLLIPLVQFLKERSISEIFFPDFLDDNHSEDFVSEYYSNIKYLDNIITIYFTSKVNNDIEQLNQIDLEQVDIAIAIYPLIHYFIDEEDIDEDFDEFLLKSFDQTFIDEFKLVEGKFNILFKTSKEEDRFNLGL